MRGLLKYSIIILLLIHFKGFANETQYVFKKLTNENGLSYNSVKEIVQDSTGVMWFATKQGLNKYNSYNIQKYYFEDNVGLPSNMILSLLITSSNQLFVGTTNGLCVYNRKFDNFSPLHYEGTSIMNINALAESKAGTILIGTSNGIFLYYPVQNIIVKIVSLQNENITSILEYKDGEFIIATFSGIYILNTDGVIKNYFDTNNTSTLTSNKISSLYKDSLNTIWVGTDSNGLYRFNREQRTFTKIRLQDIDLAEGEVIRDIAEDRDGNIWVASEHGVYIIDITNYNVVNISHSLEKSDYHLNDNAVYCLFLSVENIMWIGTYFGGVNYTTLSNYKGFSNLYPGDGKNQLKGKAVSRIYKSSKGIIWIATEDGGVCSFDPETKTIIDYFQQTSGNSLSSNNIHSICEDDYGRIWFGHFMTGIDIYDPVTGIFKNISLSPGERYSITGNSVYSITKDSTGKIWVGSREGILTYDYASDQLIPFKPDQIQNSFIYNIMEDRTGKIWFCLRTGGLISFNPVSDTINYYEYNEEIENGLSTNQLIASTEDSKGRIWFGTIDGGLNIYHPEKDSFEVFTKKHGLPNNTIYGALEATDGTIWLSSNRGITQFNYEGGKIKNYNLQDGLSQMQFNFSSYFKDSDNTFYFGHINGLTYFNPLLVSDNFIKPRILFSDFKLSNESIKISEDGILTEQINDTEKITLNYSQKAFTIDFVAINHLSAGNNRFFYFLEGFESDWINIGNKTSVTYTNLSPGNYTFWLKAQNNDGVESLNTKKLEIKIRPPFYLSIWAYLLYAIFLVSVLFIYRKVTIDHEKEKAALSYEKIEKQKIKELNQQRLNFYTYISHEFKTPLSIIISSVDQFIDNQEITGELKVKFDRLRRSAKRLSFLFNQLMDFRKIETKHAKLVLQKGDIVGFLRETCLAFSPLFVQHRINFEFKSNKNHYEYFFDPDKIEKIVVNIVSNAVKNTPIHGEILCKVNVWDQKENEDSQNLEIIISDNGSGIDKKELSNLFTPFYAKYQSNEVKKGSGIGLTLVKSLVEYLHGTIDVQSSADSGTIFTIQLPLNYKEFSNIKLESGEDIQKRSLDIESISHFSNSEIEIRKEDSNNNEFKLLIVEDTVDLAEILREHFSKNFLVSCAKNGIEALKIVKLEEPDIIISDVMMPEMNGIEFCKKIKQEEATSHIAVILLTAKTSHYDKIAGLEAGAEAYVRKPFDLKELDLHVRNFIEIRKKLRDSVVMGENLDLDKLNFQDKDKEFIENISKIINENIEDETLNTKELAKQLGISKTLVYLKLKKLLNMSGTEYIQTLRFKKAVELMACTNQNISEIAYEIGFSDPNYFSKVFKKVYKETPTVYRKKLLTKIKGLNLN